MDELIGKTVTGLYINARHDYLVFETCEGFLAYSAEGDCCSTSWFNDILGVRRLINRRILKVEHVKMSDLEADDEYDCLQEYGIKLTTSRGYVDIIYRNESNGYYGGYCEFDKMSSERPVDVKAITEDWSADN